MYAVGKPWAATIQNLCGVKRVKSVGLALAPILVLLAGSAVASQQGTTAMLRWKQMDLCARQAQAAFPDYTAQSDAKRDAALQACLRANNLPPRETPTPLPQTR